jgi:hypothetical protein
MSSPLRQVVLLYAGALTLLWGAAFLEKGCHPDTKGDIHELRDFPSPDGRYVLSVFQKVFHNTTGYPRHIHLSRKGEKVQYPGNIYALPVWEDVAVSWTSTTNLSLTLRFQTPTIRRGTVKMTQPTVIFFGPDSGRDDPPLPKIFLRTHLFSTARRGRVIECMHVALSRGETHQNFSIWVYGDDKLVRGSGLHIGETGLSSNHHFLVPNDCTSFRFSEGRYRVEVFAKLMGDKRHRLLFSTTLEISHEMATQLENQNTGIYFDWGPDSARYLTHVEKRRIPANPFRADQLK